MRRPRAHLAQHRLVQRPVGVLGSYAITIALLVTLNFFLPRVLPGDPIDALIAQSATNFTFGEESRAALEGYYATDRPLLEQFGHYVSELAHGDLGRSIVTNAPVGSEIWRRLPWTILLIGTSLVLAAEQYDVDVGAANALLDAAGYAAGDGGTRTAPDGSQLNFELLVSNTEIPLAELLAGALAQIGVTITINAVEIGPQLFGTKLSGGYDMALLIYPGPSAGGPNADPDPLRQLFSSTSPPSLTGASGYVDPAFDELAGRQRVTFDERERMELVADMQQILADDIPVLALYYPETVLVFRKDVLDEWYFTPGDFPTAANNKQLFITGLRSGTAIRPTE